MAVNDWNHDGQKNAVDDYVDYKLSSEGSNDSPNKPNRNPNNPFTLTLVDVIGSLLLGFYLMIKFYVAIEVDLADISMVLFLFSFIIAVILAYFIIHIIKGLFK